MEQQSSKCNAGNCDRHSAKKGLCTMHHQRLKRNGSTQNGQGVDSRFWNKCSIADNGCWEWQGFLNPAGYGQFSAGNGKVMLTHRWTYQRFVGPLIDGMHIDHLCRNVKCCNPEHLEQVTPRVNMERTTGHRHSHYSKGNRSHCGNGHEMTPENSYKRPGRVNSYACRACHAEYSRQWLIRREGKI